MCHVNNGHKWWKLVDISHNSKFYVNVLLEFCRYLFCTWILEHIQKGSQLITEERISATLQEHMMESSTCGRECRTNSESGRRRIVHAAQNYQSTTTIAGKTWHAAHPHSPNNDRWDTGCFNKIMQWQGQSCYRIYRYPYTLVGLFRSSWACHHHEEARKAVVVRNSHQNFWTKRLHSSLCSIHVDAPLENI